MDDVDLFGNPIPPPSDALRPVIERIYRRWQELGGFDQRRLTSAREAKIRRRLAHYSEAELMQVLEIAFQDPGTLGRNRWQRPYTDIMNIFRNDERVDMYLAMAPPDLLPRTGARTERF